MVGFGEKVTGIGPFFLISNFGDEILLRGEECDIPEIWGNINLIIYIKN